VLLDLSLLPTPRASRRDAAAGGRPDVPIVILSGCRTSCSPKAVEGAQDYLVKGRVDGAAIGRSIRYSVERKALEMHNTHKALHDHLTGLPNRDLFQDRLKHAVTRARRHQSLVGVMFLDLDGFKPINDSLGHDVGDKLLVALASRLKDALRGSDTAARIGGDEFVVLCEDVADEQHVINIAERLQRAIAEPFMIDEHELGVTSSMGIVVSRRPREERRGTGPQRRRGDVPGEAPGHRVRGVRRRHAQPGARARAHRVGPPACRRAARVQAPVPAPGQPKQRRDRRARGVDPLGPSGAGTSQSDAICPPRGRNRIDNPDRPVGAADRV
jgi:diguanylate cyclase (GGDEF)-like protein